MYIFFIILTEDTDLMDILAILRLGWLQPQKEVTLFAHYVHEQKQKMPGKKFLCLAFFTVIFCRLYVKWLILRQTVMATDDPHCTKNFIVLTDDDMTDDDNVVSSINGINYYMELYHHDILATTLHIYPSGGHGWSVRENFMYHD